jgi:hypothetical protein
MAIDDSSAAKAPDYRTARTMQCNTLRGAA